MLIRWWTKSILGVTRPTPRGKDPKEHQKDLTKACNEGGSSSTFE
jgi:hypothetical protein